MAATSTRSKVAYKDLRGYLDQLEEAGLLKYVEYEAAGAWRGTPTELVKCELSDLLVPANAEYIIEGELLPGERTVEGPTVKRAVSTGRTCRPSWSTSRPSRTDRTRLTTG